MRGSDAFHVSQACVSMSSSRVISIRPSERGSGAAGKYLASATAGNPIDAISRAQYLMRFLDGLKVEIRLTHANADRS